MIFFNSKSTYLFRHHKRLVAFTEILVVFFMFKEIVKQNCWCRFPILSLSWIHKLDMLKNELPPTWNATYWEYYWFMILDQVFRSCIKIIENTTTKSSTARALFISLESFFDPFFVWTKNWFKVIVNPATCALSKRD